MPDLWDTNPHGAASTPMSGPTRPPATTTTYPGDQAQG